MSRPPYWILCCATLSACTSPTPAPTAEPETRSAASASSRFVAIVRPEDGSILEAPAIVRGSSGAFGEVTAPASLRIARVHVQVGDEVAVGDPIVDVYAPALLDAAATYLSDRSQLRMHEERAGELEARLKEGLVGRPEVFRERAVAAKLRASLLQSLAILRSSGIDPAQASPLIDRGVITLDAPVAGIVTELSARVGQSYEPGPTSIAHVTGKASGRIEVRTAEPWPRAKSVSFTANDGLQIALLPAPVASAVVPSDGTTRSWFEPAEPVDLPDGLLGTARVEAADDVWEVPIEAIHPEAGETTIVRQRGPSTETVSVEVIAASGASAWVRGALEAGDRVANPFPNREIGSSE